MIKVAQEQLRIVLEILARYVPGAEVRAFGSRVEGTPKPYSDLDLAIVGQEPLDIAVLGRLKDAFSESDLPFRVDLLDWNSTSDDFKKVIERQYEVLQRPRR